MTPGVGQPRVEQELQHRPSRPLELNRPSAASEAPGNTKPALRETDATTGQPVAKARTEESHAEA